MAEIQHLKVSHLKPMITFQSSLAEIPTSSPGNKVQTDMITFRGVLFLTEAWIGLQAVIVTFDGNTRFKYFFLKFIC